MTEDSWIRKNVTETGKFYIISYFHLFGHNFWHIFSVIRVIWQKNNRFHKYRKKGPYGVKPTASTCGACFPSNHLNLRRRQPKCRGHRLPCTREIRGTRCVGPAARPSPPPERSPYLRSGSDIDLRPEKTNACGDRDENHIASNTKTYDVLGGGVQQFQSCVDYDRKGTVHRLSLQKVRYTRLWLEKVRYIGYDLTRYITIVYTR